MTSTLRTRSVISLLALAVLLAASTDAWAQRKPRPACNINTLPLIEGNEWVYKAVTLETDPEVLKKMRARPVPKQPDEFKITVVSVKQLENKTTEITLKEVGKDLYELTTVLNCTRDKLTVPPESFFFMGEPGAGNQLVLNNREQEGPSFTFRAGRLVPGATFNEYIKADIDRKAADGSEATHPAAKLDIERKVTVAGVPTEITTELGAFQALQIRTELLGSIKVDAPDAGEQPNELLVPANTLSDTWFARNTGIVQVRNRWGHNYHLVDAKLN